MWTVWNRLEALFFHSFPPRSVCLCLLLRHMDGILYMWWWRRRQHLFKNVLKTTAKKRKREREKYRIQKRYFQSFFYSYDFSRIFFWLATPKHTKSSNVHYVGLGIVVHSQHTMARVVVAAAAAKIHTNIDYNVKDIGKMQMIMTKTAAALSKCSISSSPIAEQQTHNSDGYSHQLFSTNFSAACFSRSLAKFPIIFFQVNFALDFAPN